MGRFDEVFCVKKFVADKSDVFRLNCKLELIVSKGYGLVYLVLVVRAKESFVGLRCCRRRSGLEKRGLWCLPPVKRYFTSLTIKPERPCKLALLLHYDRGHSEGLLLLGRSRGRGGRKERRHGIKKCTSLVLRKRKKGLVFIVSKKTYLNGFRRGIIIKGVKLRLWYCLEVHEGHWTRGQKAS